MNRIAVLSVIALSALGLLDSAFLVMRDYEYAGLSHASGSGVCQLSGDGCSIVAKSDAANLMGVPVALFGVLYFSLLLGVSLIRLRLQFWPAPALMAGIIIAGVAFSGYLLYEMLAVVRAVCPYCIFAHMVNVGAAVMFGVSYHLDHYRQRIYV